jgi:pyruvate dehydrogenase E1 component
VLRGLYLFRPTPKGRTKLRAQLFGSGSIMNEVLRAAAILEADYRVAVDVWSVTSYKSLHRDALDVERWNRLHPGEAQRSPMVTDLLAGGDGPVVAVSDFMAAVPDQIGRWVGRPWSVLGTDGFGRSDTREQLRRWFEVDTGHLVVATLAALAASGEVKSEVVADAIRHHGIDPDRLPPRLP